MDNQSVWQSFPLETNFPELLTEMTVDVAIIGGGITGLTAAQLLKKEGLKVVVLEGHKIGFNNTGCSTGNLYEVMGAELVDIRKKYSADLVEKLILSRREAIDFIEENVKNLSLDCDFRRVPWHYYSGVEEKDKEIDKHMAVCLEAGLKVESVDIAHPSLPVRKGIRIDHQAQFNPFRYVQGLAHKINDYGCMIFENSMVRDIEDQDGIVTVKTERGSVKANFVIHATHTPKGISGYHTLLEPFREYGIACKIKDPQHPPGIYFGYHGSDHVYSTRSYEHDGQQYLIVVGSPHKVGHDSTEEHMQELITFAKTRFDVEDVTHIWGGQHYRPADELPFIGKKPGTDAKIFVATGFHVHGLVYGTVAARIITDTIMGKKNEYAEMYSSTRFTPIKSAKKFVKENASNFFDMVTDYMKRNKNAFDEIRPGQGKIVDNGIHKLAVSRDEATSQLNVCSAVCTHLGCVVRWNDHENSWDCPCHGSRFDTSGEVIEGPALFALAKAEIVQEEEQAPNLLKRIQDNFESGQDFA